jgi:translation initiation factor 2 beta subunit (eIF-2beta)/eIF-5
MIEDIKEYMKEYVKEYYANNKDEIVRKRQEKMVCSKCGKTVTRQAVWAHKKSKKCLKIQGLLPVETKSNEF